MSTQPAYEGHLPDGSPIQKHSAGELFPVVIVVYGDGTARWIDPHKRTASGRCMSHRVCEDHARLYVRGGGATGSKRYREYLRYNYARYLLGE